MYKTAMHYLLNLWLLVFIHGCCAGELHPRVYDGQELRPYMHKYLVQLKNNYKHINNSSLYYTLCSGSILNQRWIISAAHCFHNNVINVEVEKWDLQILGYVDKTQITLLPGFKYEIPARYISSEKDLALLKTRKNMKLGLFTKPIFLSTRSPKIGELVVIAGYGDAEHGLSVPREGTTTVTKCEHPKTKLICTQSTLRAGPGDSGGALVSRGRLVGVTSAGCEDVEIHKDCETVYVDVALHLNWINEVMFNRTGM